MDAHDKNPSTDHPRHHGDADDTQPLIVVICASLAATVIVLGVMWANNGRDMGGGQPVAEQQLR